MDDFRTRMESGQLNWRRSQGSRVTQQPYRWRITDRRHGGHREIDIPLAFPRRNWTDNLWPDIRDDLRRLTADKIHRHTWSHHLLSSWVLCANLYFPFGRTEHGRTLLAAFLREQQLAPEFDHLERVELEYAPDDLGDVLHPKALLGEADGRRGSGQTSPDVAFLGRAKSGAPVAVLVESKFTEHSFYACSGRKKAPDCSTVPLCDRPLAVLDSAPTACALLGRKPDRRYWEHLAPAANRQAFERLRTCPAATAGYQLLRQQALAEGYARSDAYRSGAIVSAVAWDERNHTLAASLRRTGLAHFRDWSTLFDGRARFATFTHQSWVAWVRQQDRHGSWSGWLSYVQGRYGY
jgi:hypothetical protein